MGKDALSVFIKYKSLMKYEPEKPDEKFLAEFKDKALAESYESQSDEEEEEEENE